ncbi:hypothetical protein H4R33_001143 [Dimargaris cristalligena]|uniref:Uncharacterized protein n=1 Tax=Dimargaris cristalligena TaxID=215637 RepID=A0A4P9ZR08_9FUNG|nr:hypothetical protein H4R33_001143 [Dimargaris cristalligena]RKP35863.1 hypothetical protein BJ085DRAFT_35897 [Dimargaris cristalligena]|eukprot:RKP35863.1 hypothetical protein BJ085DRAFT_35897 [Dimargaris cristalligena]
MVFEAAPRRAPLFLQDGLQISLTSSAYFSDEEYPPTKSCPSRPSSIRSADSWSATTCLPPSSAPESFGCSPKLRSTHPSGGPLAHPLADFGPPLPRSNTKGCRTRRKRLPANLPPQIPRFGRPTAKPLLLPTSTPATHPNLGLKPAPVVVPLDPEAPLPFRRSPPSPRLAFNELPLHRSRLADCNITNPFDLAVEVRQPEQQRSAELFVFRHSFFEPDLPEDPQVPLETFAYKESPLVSPYRRPPPSTPRSHSLDYLDEKCRHWLFQSGTDANAAHPSHPSSSPAAPVTSIMYTTPDAAEDMQAYYQLIRRRMLPHHVLTNARLVLARERLNPTRASVLLYNHDILNNRCLFSLLDPKAAVEFHDKYFPEENQLFLGTSAGSDRSLSPLTMVEPADSDYLTTSPRRLEGPPGHPLSPNEEPLPGLLPNDDDSLFERQAPETLDTASATLKSGLSTLNLETESSLPGGAPSGDSGPPLLSSDPAITPAGGDEPLVYSLSPSITISDTTSMTVTAATSPLMVDWYGTCWPVETANSPDDVDYMALLGWDPLQPHTKPRSTRFNPACWRMMAIENRMMINGKIVAPLKKRLNLPRRRDMPNRL